MPFSDLSSSPPGPSTSADDAIAYYKAQYETLESELADFQNSSKELEAELEKDIEASEKRERQLKEKAENLAYEVDEWKQKYRLSKTEANAAQNTLQKEITALRDTSRTQQLRLRDTEVANDDYERQQRNTESSLEDLESKYSVAIERSILLEEEVKTGEQEREALRIDAQRMRDELSDLRIETEIVKEKLRKAGEYAHPRTKLSYLEPAPPSTSPRSELSPTNSDSAPSFDTPPGKTASSSGLSDTHTPPSPPISEKSTNGPKAFKTPARVMPRMSLTSDNNTTPRQSTYGLKPPSHTRGPSVPVVTGRATPSNNFRQSVSRPPRASQRPYGLAQSNSIHQLHNLQGKMQRLTERVNTAKSKLPGPVNTPPKSSPRAGPGAQLPHIPANVTVRSSRKRATGSIVSGTDSLADSIQGPSSARTQMNRQSMTTSMAPPLSTPTQSRNAPLSSSTFDKPHAPPFVRPSSRASAASSSTFSSRLHSQAQNQTTPRTQTGTPSRELYSRPSSRTSNISASHRLQNRHSTHFLPPNVSTDRIRPKSTLSNYGTDGAGDEPDLPDVNEAEDADVATPTPRHRNIRVSDVGVAGGIPTPGGKRTSISRLPRVSLGRVAPNVVGGNSNGELVRPSSSRSNASSSSKGYGFRGVDEDVGEDGEVDETF